MDIPKQAVVLGQRVSDIEKRAVDFVRQVLNIPKQAVVLGQRVSDIEKQAVVLARRVLDEGKQPIGADFRPSGE